MPFVDWVNKNQAKERTHHVPVHLLQQEATYGDASGQFSDNLLIQGDNLLALKALMPVYAGRINCIFIDPPYNTQSAFEHYDDKLEHSQWLSMMYPRLVLLRELLSEAGTIWMTLDDSEVHYLKVMADEIFGRKNFVCSFAWEKDKGRRGDAVVSSAHDHVLLYARDWSVWRRRRNLLPRTEAHNARYKNPDDDIRGPWLQGDNGTAKSGSDKSRYEITLPSGRVVVPPSGNYWRFSRETFEKALEEGRVWFGRQGDSMPVIKRYLSEVQDGIVPRTWWPAEDAGTNQSAKRDHLRKLLPEITPFATPKPEQLIQLVLQISTNKHDLVLDSFLGSGTTAAVAHKMGRRYIGIEMGNHARTHCVPRLEKVIDGEQGGVSASVNWQGGGGFKFCTLGERAFDADGRINSEVRFNTLAAFIWHFETATPAADSFDKPFLGVHEGKAYYLLYNGILGDKRLNGGNVLTRSVLQMLKEQYPHEGPKVIYGETTRLGDASLVAEGVTFQQIPYDIKVR